MIDAVRKLTLVATVVLCAATARAGDPMSPAQEIQALQSGLEILGHDPGPIDGLMGPLTRAAIAAFVDATGFAGDAYGASPDLVNAVLTEVGPAMEASFGTDPTGFWDLDHEASGFGPNPTGEQICASSWQGYFSGGIIWRHGESGFPLVMRLVDERLEVLPIPAGEFIEPFYYTVVDTDTMHRRAEGETEVWVRCPE